MRRILTTILLIAGAALTATNEGNAAGYRKLVIPLMDTSALDVIGTRLHIEILGDVADAALRSKKYDSLYAHFMVRQWKEAPSRVRGDALPLPVRDTTTGSTAELNVGLLRADTLEDRRSGCRIKLTFGIRIVDHVSRAELSSDTCSVTYDEAWANSSKGHDIVAGGALAFGALGALISSAMVPEGRVRDIRNTFRSAIVQLVTIRFPREHHSNGKQP